MDKLDEIGKMVRQLNSILYRYCVYCMVCYGICMLANVLHVNGSVLLSGGHSYCSHYIVGHICPLC